MVSTHGLTHQRAASSILALSTRNDRCAAEKTVIDWCGVRLCVTGAAQRSGPRHLKLSATGLFFQLFAHLSPAAKIRVKVGISARRRDVFERAHVAIAQQTLAQLNVFFDVALAVVREVRDAGTACGADLLQLFDRHRALVVLHER